MKWTSVRRRRAAHLLGKFSETMLWMVVAAPFVASRPLGRGAWVIMGCLFGACIYGAIVFTERRDQWKE